MSNSALPQVINAILCDANRRRTVMRWETISDKQKSMLQNIAQKAAVVFNAPISQITLLGDTTQSFLVSLGFDIEQTPTETSFCAHALAADTPIFVVLDTTKDERFKDNPFVVGDTHIRFYIGCPIIVDDQRIGTICLYDYEARESITREQSRLLVDMAWDAAIVLDR